MSALYRWKFPPFFRGHWQSIAKSEWQALSGLCIETVKESSGIAMLLIHLFHRLFHSLLAQPWQQALQSYSHQARTEKLSTFFTTNFGPLLIFGLTTRKWIWTSGPSHWWFCMHNVNILFKSIPNVFIATNFCTCHDSKAVVPCVKICSNYFHRLKWRKFFITFFIWVRDS